MFLPFEHEAIPEHPVSMFSKAKIANFKKSEKGR